MKIRSLAHLSAAASLAVSAHAQGTFQNLDFEAAQVVFAAPLQIAASNALPGWTADYPLRVFSLDGKGGARLEPDGHKPFRVYGPTCDTLDVLPRPLMLPETIKPGDFIVIEAIGAYSIALRTNFNGFYPDTWAIVGN